MSNVNQFYLVIEWMQIILHLSSERYSKFNGSKFIYELQKDGERIFGLKTLNGEVWEIKT